MLKASFCYGDRFRQLCKYICLETLIFSCYFTHFRFTATLLRSRQQEETKFVKNVLALLLALVYSYQYVAHADRSV